MRLFAIGDIHGCGTALDSILAAICPQPEDRIVSLGDYINKGPETRTVIDRLMQLYSAGMLIPLLGNHEIQWRLAFRLHQVRCGQNVLIDQATLDSYRAEGHSGAFEDIPEGHWRFVEEACVPWFETDTHIFVHANLDEHKPLSDQPPSALFWDKFKHPRPHCSSKTMVCGHTPQDDGRPINLGHAICLDTGACEGQWLTCLEIHSGNVWQTNQQKQVRRSNIGDYLVGSQASADSSGPQRLAHTEGWQA
jgi:serine/threonine protein phosphatase 1